MTDPRVALTNLSNALPADPADDGPIGVDSSDLRAVLQLAQERDEDSYVAGQKALAESVRVLLRQHTGEGS